MESGDVIVYGVADGKTYIARLKRIRSDGLSAPHRQRRLRARRLDGAPALDAETLGRTVLMPAWCVVSGLVTVCRAQRMLGDRLVEESG